MTQLSLTAVAAVIRNRCPFRWRFLVVLLTFPVGLVGRTTVARAAEPLTVMTWNVEWFYDDETGDNHSDLAKEKSAPDRAGWNWRRDAVAKRIAQARPTLLALQEVESRRVMWYLTRALDRNHSMDYGEIGFESRDHYTEQDVGILVRSPAEVLLSSQFFRDGRLRRGDTYYDVSKHLLVAFDYPAGDGFERVSVLTVHLRSGAAGEPFRKRQARLIHHWIAGAIKRGENMIVLGDFNTDESANSIRPGSDLAILAGHETADTADDLVDLNLRLAPQQRQTHLLKGKQFDRIFCSPSLLRDEPGRKDLVFRSIEVRRDLVVQGRVDTVTEHFDQYWSLPADQRDLSDHYPVMATFDVR